MRPHRRCAKLALILSLPLFAACGGGGGEDERTGVFLGAPVAGLEYETTSLRGVTDDEGRFSFLEGETITFRLGDTELGTAPASERMTPLDLVPEAVAPTTNDALFEAVDGRAATPEGTLLNLLVFLQTLDADDDLENGIRIPAEVPGLLTGVQIDFTRSVRQFEEHAPFRQLIRSGLDLGLWGGVGRPIRHVGLALDHFYAQAGIAHRFERAVRFEYDRDGSGQNIETFHLTYAPDLRTVEQIGHRDADGVVDVFYRLQLDPHGRPTLRFLDEDNDGSPESLTIYDLSANGDVEQETNYVGVVPQFTEVSTLDTLGLVRLLTTDLLADGTMDKRQTLVRDEDGMVVRRETDKDANGDADAVALEQFDDDGRLILQEYDDNGNGTIQRRTRYAYDARGRIRVVEADSNADGVVDARTTHAYDDAQMLETRTSDNNADGIPNRITRTRRDSLGRIVSREEDDGANGTVDRRVTFRYEGNVELEEADLDANGTIDEVYRTVRNDAGNAVERTHDSDADGRPEYRDVVGYEPGSAFTALLSD